MKIRNPHLANIGDDNFHHLGFNTSSTDMKKEYSDVKVSLLGCCQQSIQLFVYCLAGKTHHVVIAKAQRMYDGRIIYILSICDNVLNMFQALARHFMFFC